MQLDKIRPARSQLEKSKGAELESEQKLSKERSSEKVLEFAQRIKNGQIHAFDLLNQLPQEVSFDSPDGNEYERMYRGIFDVAREHPELVQELGEMENLIAQNPQMMRPSALLDIAGDVMWEPRIHGYLKTSMIHGLGYALRFMQSPEYEKTITQKLDFSNPENFTETAHFLEFMQNLYNIGDDYSYGGDNVVVSRVRDALGRAVEKQQGSYLLNVRAQELLTEMDEGRSWVASGFDRTPFLITKDCYARHKEDGLYVASPDQRKNIEELIGAFNAVESELKPPQHLIDEAIANGEDEVWWEPDQNLMRRRNQLYERIDEQFTHRVTFEELSPGEEVSGDQAAIEEHDFAYLQRKPIRETIKNDFEIEIANLALQEQYQLLVFLKTVEKKAASPLFLEATRLLRRRGALDLNDIRGGSMEVMIGNNVTDDDKESIRAAQERLYAGKYPEEEMQELRDGLTEAFKNPFTRFYLYRKDNEIITFVRFSDLANSNNAYMGSFMTNPKYEGGGLGQALLEVALEREIASGKPIMAVCDPSLVSFYEEKFGFVKLRGPYNDAHGVETCDIGLFPSSESLREAA